MPIIVVAGSGRNVGKTALVCGLIAALPEFRWAGVKITGHMHGAPEPIWEETTPGQGTDTARYLAAGAERAFLMTAMSDDHLPVLVRELRNKLEPSFSLIFESNRVLHYLKPDLCLAAIGTESSVPKPSFARIAHLINGTVVRTEKDRVIEGPIPQFELVDLDKISAGLHQWLRHQLASR